MDELEEIKITFFQECDELLGDLETGLLTLETGAGDGETVNAVFRAVHSIKGGAGAFGLEALVRYAHVFETLMDGVRAGRIEQSGDLIRLLLRAADVLADQVSAARSGGEADAARTADMVVELEEATNGGPAATPAASAPATAPASPEEPDDDLGFAFKPMLVEIAAPEALSPAPSAWRITFTPSPRLYAKANETGLLLRELARLGPIEISVDDSQLPGLVRRRQTGWIDLACIEQAIQERRFANGSFEERRQAGVTP